MLRSVPPSALALAATSGVLRFLCVPGFPGWFTAFVYAVPLLLALDRTAARNGARGAGWRRAAALGAVCGFTGSVGGYYWLVGTLRDFSGLPLPVYLAIFALLSAYHAGEYVLAACLIDRARGRGFPELLVVPAAVAAIELVYPLMFPNNAGAALIAVPLLAQAADLGGPLLLSVVVGMANAGAYQVVQDLAARRAPRPGAPLAAALALALTALYGAVRMPAVQARMDGAPALRLGLVQVNMGIFAKAEEPYIGLERHLEQSEALERASEIDLLLWPESAYNFRIPEGARNLAASVTRGRIRSPVLFGALRSETTAEPGRPRHYNSAFLIDGDGTVLGTVDKTYLLVFGEYLPFGEWFPALHDLSPQTGRFTRGSHVRPLELGGTRISALICYEDILPRFVRRAVREADPHLLVNLTNDAWFGDTREPEIHLALARLRSIEHRRYLARATNTGVSAIIDALGRVTVRGGVFRRESLEGEVRLLTGRTVYGRVGDVVGWAGLLAIGWAVRPLRSPGAGQESGPAGTRAERGGATPNA